MCLTCGEHVWYFEKDPQPPNSLQLLVAGLLRDVIIKNGLKLVEKRQPYGEEKFSGATLKIFQEATRLIHGMQTISSLETAGDILQGAEKVAVTYCDCIYYMGSVDGAWPKGTEIPRCLAIGYMADEELRAGRAREVNYDEAIGIVKEWREKGARQAVGWITGKPGRRPVSWLCNCDINCGQHKASENEAAMIPSYVIASLENKDQCTHCGECVSWCTAGRGMEFDLNEGVPVIHDDSCKGCGLCVDNCPTGALGFKLRPKVLDPRTGKYISQVTG